MTPHDTLVSAFDRIAAAQPDSVAVVCGSARYSYQVLGARANHIARRLREQGVGANSFVAIYLDRSPEMLAAMLGILKAGGAYLPVDSTYPVSRVLEMLEDARPAVILTTAALAGGLPKLTNSSTLTLTLEDLALTQTAEGADDLPQASGPDDLAYLMYTSGSTGKPKGVMVTHRNVVRLLQQTEPWFHFGPSDVWTMFHSIAFDFSVWEIWGCLLSGGRLVMVPFAVSRSPQDFYALLAEERVTVLNQTPSAFSMLMQVEAASARKPLDLRLVIFGGEALQYRKLKPWFERHGDQTPQLVNMYGITETTVHVTYRVVTAADAESEQESLIGVAIPDMQIHLLDANFKPVPQGETGELYVGGGGVARGYLNRPQLNAERFLADPFSQQPSGRLYRSGDLARVRADGEMVYLGRNDGQVKINGFRIELGEVEAAVTAYPGVQQACVVAHQEANGTQRLAAYFVTAAEDLVTARALSDFLAGRLPAHMRPSFYTRIERLPLTVNGKLDHAALPTPSRGVIAGEVLAVQPSSAAQARVATICCEAIGAGVIGLDDNFFDVGGTSLQLIEAHLRLQAEFDRQFPITWMFERPTVRSLAQQILLEAPLPASSNGFERQAQKQREAFARARAVRSGVR